MRAKAIGSTATPLTCRAMSLNCTDLIWIFSGVRNCNSLNRAALDLSVARSLARLLLAALTWLKLVSSSSERCRALLI